MSALVAAFSDTLGVKNQKDLDKIVKGIILDDLKEKAEDLSQVADAVANVVAENVEAQLNSSLEQFAQALYNKLPQDDGTQSQQQQSTELPADGTRDVQPQSTELKEDKIRIIKSKLVDLISEQVKEQTQIVDIDKDQLVALVTEEAFKQINRKK